MSEEMSTIVDDEVPQILIDPPSLPTSSTFGNWPDKGKRRKQEHPHRSLKQLASVADKILHGIIIIEPVLPWERNAPLRPQPSSSSLSFVRSARDYLPHTHYSHRMSRKGKRYRGSDEGEELSGLTMFIGSGSSTTSDTSINGQAHLGSSGGSNLDLTNRPTITRSPAPMGNALPEDISEPGLSHRQSLYESILIKRRASGGIGGGSGRGGMPLDITSAPGSSLLEDADFEVCSLLRLYPLQFFQSRETLLRNYRDRGFYKKSAAQKMLHIDVNKTGKLYDYFVRRNWMPVSGELGDMAKVRSPPSVDWQAVIP